MRALAKSWSVGCGSTRLFLSGSILARGKDAEIDELITSLPLAVEQSAGERTGFVNGAEILLVEKDARSCRRVQEIALEFLLAGFRQFPGGVERRAQLLDPGLPFCVFNFHFNEERTTTGAAATSRKYRVLEET